MLSSLLLKSYRYIHLDVFTARIFGGNQLAVVLDGRGLAAADMQAIANEMNFSETTFAPCSISCQPSIFRTFI